MKYRKSVFRSLAMVTQLGLSMITPIFLCIFIGYQLDRQFGTKTLLPMLILGVLAGARSTWKLAKMTLKEAEREEAALRAGRESSAGRTGICKPKQPSRIRHDREADR